MLHHRIPFPPDWILSIAVEYSEMSSIGKQVLWGNTGDCNCAAVATLTTLFIYSTTAKQAEHMHSTNAYNMTQIQVLSL